MFISQKEWKEHHGGAQGGVLDEAAARQNLKRRRVPIDACGLSLAPCRYPVLARVGHPILYDLPNIVNFVKEQRRDPISGRPITGKDLIRVRFARGEDGRYICPASRKPIGPYAAATVVLTTGNVFLTDAINALCIKTRCYQDPLDSSEFDPEKDLLVLNDPADPAYRDIQRWTAELQGRAAIAGKQSNLQAPLISRAGTASGSASGSLSLPRSTNSGASALHESVPSYTPRSASSVSGDTAGSTRGLDSKGPTPAPVTQLDDVSSTILRQLDERRQKRQRFQDEQAARGLSDQKPDDEEDNPFSSKGGLGSFAPPAKKLRISAPASRLSGPDGYGGGGEGTGDPESERARAVELGDAYHNPGDYDRPQAGASGIGNGGKAKLESKSASFTSTAMASRGGGGARCPSVTDVIATRLDRVRGLYKSAFLRVTIGATKWQHPEPENEAQLARVAASAMTDILGTLSIELFASVAPLTCHNFLQLVRRGYYNGVAFHRLIRNFMVQGGDPTATGKGGLGWDGGKFRNECSDRGSKAAGLKHTERGLLSMANAGPNTNGSQFFILFQPAAHLDGKHTVFGKVVGGTPTLRAIELEETRDGNKPYRRICMCKWEVFADPFMEDAESRKQTQPAQSPEGLGVSAPAERSYATKAASPQLYSSGKTSAPPAAGGAAYPAEGVSTAKAVKQPDPSSKRGLLDSGLDVDW